MFLVPLGVASELRSPVGHVRFWRPGIRARPTRVKVPKTAVDENDFPARPKNEIGFAGNIAGVQAVSVTKAEGQPPHREFRPRVLRSDRGHVAAAAGGG